MHHYQRRAMIDSLDHWLLRLRQQLYSAGESTGAVEHVPAQLAFAQALAAIDVYAARQIRELQAQAANRQKK